MQPRRAPTLSTEQVAGEREAALGHGRGGATRQVHGGVRKGRGRGPAAANLGEQGRASKWVHPRRSPTQVQARRAGGIRTWGSVCARSGRKQGAAGPPARRPGERGAGSDSPGNGARGDRGAKGRRLRALATPLTSPVHGPRPGEGQGFPLACPRVLGPATPRTAQRSKVHLPNLSFRCKLLLCTRGQAASGTFSRSWHPMGGVGWVCSTQRWLKVGGDSRIFSHFICMCSRLAKVSGASSCLPRSKCRGQALGIPTEGVWPLWRGKTAHSLTALPSFHRALVPLGSGEWEEWAAQELGGSDWSSFSLRCSGGKWEPCRQGLVASGSWGVPGLAQAPLGVLPFLDCWSALREPCFSSPCLGDDPSSLGWLGKKLPGEQTSPPLEGCRPNLLKFLPQCGSHEVSMAQSDSWAR